VYRTWVIGDNNTPPIEGYLSRLRDCSIVIYAFTGQNRVERIPVELRIRRIEALKFRKECRKGRGALVGSGAGLLIGFMSGSSTSDFMPTASGLIVGGAGEATGSILGAVAGFFRISIPLDGGSEHLMKQRERLVQYLYYW
jgi:hypothetical protein